MGLVGFECGKCGALFTCCMFHVLLTLNPQHAKTFAVVGSLFPPLPDDRMRTGGAEHGMLRSQQRASRETDGIKWTEGEHLQQALLLWALYTSVQGRPLEEASARFSCRHKFSSVDFPVSSSLRMERINGGSSPGLVSGGLEKVYDLCGQEASFHQGNLNILHQILSNWRAPVVAHKLPTLVIPATMGLPATAKNREIASHALSLQPGLRYNTLMALLNGHDRRLTSKAGGIRYSQVRWTLCNLESQRLRRGKGQD
ncbi:hypothetical protein EYF80_024648 [Liparis tanakae]|uniref:Uncharacterized protein n=1 Tax=Liparis tanakae TaxID=230148 RepID=A0A4Z2HGY1_9TELE|nr:hypothetical protein EYF80_024648 [Liparis tanakae]